jgi:peptide/nickel transport system ATP-binding protein
VNYTTRPGLAPAVNDVTFSLRPGERLGLIGESGSGKTTTAMAIMRLLRPPARITAGRVLLGDRDVMSMNQSQLRRVRLSEVALVPQGAMNSLNPVMRVGEQIRDGIAAHGGQREAAQIRTRVAQLLERVGLPPDVARQYPHQLSGGMKQRVAIAIAASLQPKVIIADEPTSALDVVVQRQVIATLAEVQKQARSAVLLIGHDMGLVAQFAHTVGVLYGGRLVELGPAEQIVSSPRHPYTRMLVDSLPELEGKQRLVGIPGLPPALSAMPTGCPFHPRCPWAFDACRASMPPTLEAEEGRQVACHLYPKHSSLPEPPAPPPAQEPADRDAAEAGHV